jgi:hypothetical protein
VPSVEENLAAWNDGYDWVLEGDEWSAGRPRRSGLGACFRDCAVAARSHGAGEIAPGTEGGPTSSPSTVTG